MNENDLLTVASVGTAVLFLLAIAIIGFVVLYQRKIFNKQSRIAELETANQKELVNAVLVAKELEQKRIAQELHDEIDSSINTIKMSLIRMNLDRELKDQLSSELQDISKNVRRISNELMPSALDELGFHTALEHLIKKFQSSTSIQFEFHSELDDPFELDKQVELGLYRVLQELINNIVKYAQATEVLLSLHHTSEFIDIQLIDNGTGFIPDVNHLSKGDSLGLKNIKSRIQQINGQEEYELMNPKGTKVRIHLKNSTK